MKPRVDTLIDAKKRGVDVRIMVSGIHNDNWFARHNSVRLYGPLLEAGIEILEFNRTMLHQKTMVVDARLGDGRHDELRQPLVRAQRGEQRLRLRRGLGTAAARHLPGATSPAAIASRSRRGATAASCRRATEIFASLVQDQI